MGVLRCSLWKELGCKVGAASDRSITCLQSARSSVSDVPSVVEKLRMHCPLIVSAETDINSSSRTVTLFDGQIVDPIKLFAGIAAAPIDSENLQHGLDWLLYFLCHAFGADDG